MRLRALSYMSRIVAIILVLAIPLLWMEGSGTDEYTIACGATTSWLESSVTNNWGLFGYYATSTTHHNGDLVADDSTVHMRALLVTVLLTVVLLGGAWVMWTRTRRLRVG